MLRAIAFLIPLSGSPPLLSRDDSYKYSYPPPPPLHPLHFTRRFNSTNLSNLAMLDKLSLPWGKVSLGHPWAMDDQQV